MPMSKDSICTQSYRWNKDIPSVALSTVFMNNWFNFETRNLHVNTYYVEYGWYKSKDCNRAQLSVKTHRDRTDMKYYIQAEDHRYSVVFILLAVLTDLYASCVKMRLSFT